MNEKGSSSVFVLAIVIFLSTVFIALSFYVRTNLVLEMFHKDQLQIKKLLVDEAKMVVDILSEDIKEREYDSPFDPVWEFIEENPHIMLKDVSSYLNPNCLDPPLLIHLINTMIAPDKLVKDMNYFQSNPIQDYWNNPDTEGIFLKLSPGYDEYFSKDILKKYFTPYTYFNVNNCFEFVLKRLYMIRTGNSENEADEFRKNIIKIYGKKLVEQEEFEDYLHDKLGVSTRDIEILHPALNAVPVMNIHFMPEEILRGLLTYKAFEFKHIDLSIDSINNYFTGKESGLTIDELQSNILLAVPRDFKHMLIFSYIGVFTNFWEIKVNVDNSKLRWVIARVPPLGALDDPYYKLIEEDYNL